MDYRKEIDGLRALAVIPVILFHAGFQTFSGGFVGVDVFFVISGYLITTILVTELHQGKFSIINFYERRARRILPALFLVMFVCLSFAWFWLLPQAMKEFSKSLIYVTTFISNIFFYKQSGYFDTAAELKPLLHTWSLAVEEQYYLIFPIFLMLTWHMTKRSILTLLSIIFISSLLYAEYKVGVKPKAAFFLLASRFWEILIGAFVAFYFFNKNRLQPSKVISEAGSVIGLLLLVCAVFMFDKQTPFPSLYTLVPTVGTALIILFSSQYTAVGKLLGNKLFVGIGLISYSAYLWHQPLFAFVRYKSLDEPSQLFLGSLVILSIFLAYFSWKYVEIPFRNKQKFNRKQIFIYSLIGSTFFISFGLIGKFTNGFEIRLERIDQRESVLLGNKDIYSGSRKSDNSCLDLLGVPPISEEVCLTNTKTPQILFAGDSHAMALYSSIYAQQIKVNALLISAHSCPLYPNLIYKPTINKGWGNNCNAIANKVLETAQKINSIDTVILVNNFDMVNNYKFNDRNNSKNLSNKESFIAGYDFLISNLLTQGKRVIFFVDVPHLKHEPLGCVQKLPFLEARECVYSKEHHLLIHKDYLSEVFRLKERHPELIIYDPIDFFCGDKICDIKVGKKMLYNDTNHISVFASELILSKMQRDNLLQH